MDESVLGPYHDHGLLHPFQMFTAVHLKFLDMGIISSVAEVQSKTDAVNRNRQNRTESSVQSGSDSPVLAAVQFSVLRILQNSQTI